MLYLLSYNSKVTTHALGVLSSYYIPNNNLDNIPFCFKRFAIQTDKHIAIEEIVNEYTICKVMLNAKSF